MICVLFYVLSSIAFYLLARRILKQTAAQLMATLAFMYSPVVVSYSQVVRMDIILVFALILLLYFCLEIFTDANPASFLGAGFALGMAVSSKYPGVVGCVSILWATALAWRAQRIRLSHALLWTFVAALTSVGTAFVFGPYLFFNFDEVIQDVLIEARSEHLSHSGEGFLGNLTFYLTEALPEVLGWGVFAGAAVGVLLFATNRSRMISLEIVLAFGLAFLLFISALSLHWVRWAIPLAPVAALFAGYAVEALLRRASSHFSTARSRAIAVLLGGAILLPSILATLQETLLRATNRDTRVAAQEWVQANIGRGATVIVDTYGPQLHEDDFNVVVSDEASESGFTALRSRGSIVRPNSWYPSIGRVFAQRNLQTALPTGAHYIVLSEWQERYAAERESHAAELRAYEYLLDRYRLVKEFRPGPWQLGPPILVLVAKPPKASMTGVPREGAAGGS